MRLLAAQRASFGSADASPDGLGPLPRGISADVAAVVLEGRRFGHGLHVTRASLRAIADLRAGTPELRPGRRLGLILASDRGDQHALAGRTAEFARQMSLDRRPPADLFRAIAYFPVGRVARSVAEALPAHGPIATLPADLEQARTLARVWLEAGRARQVVIVATDATDDGTSAHATAELWVGSARTDSAPGLAITSYVQRAHDGEPVPCAALAGEVIESLPPPAGHRTALVVGSMLADAGESLYAELSPRDSGAPLEQAVRSAGERLGFSETFVLVGSSGTGMNALGLAQDLVALDRADSVVACGVDLVHGALAQALGLLRCEDLPHMRGGAAGLMLQKTETSEGVDPTLRACSLVSPPLPSQHAVRMDLAGIAPRPVDAEQPAHVALSGLTSLDLACADQLAGHVWPGAPISVRGDVRSVAADALRLAATAADEPRPMGIVAVHSLGGTGWCLIA